MGISIHIHTITLKEANVKNKTVKIASPKLTRILIEQQVTLYPHRDDNNWWTFRKIDDSVPDNIEYVKDGDIVTLKHADSHTRLHSHEIRPPMTDLDYHNEVRYVKNINI